MKNNSKIAKILVPVCFLFLAGCGHSIVRTDRGTGFHLRIPNPFEPGDSLVDLKLGNIDTTMAIIRGNTSFDSASAKGGSLTGSGGISERFAVSSNPQLNEGYVAEVLTSPNLSDEAKIEIARYLSNAQAPKVSDAKSITIGAAAGSGSNVSEITPEKTGLDNIVDKTADTITKTAPTIAKATETTISNISTNTADVAKHSIDVAGKTTENIGNTISNHILIGIIVIIFIGCLIFIMLVLKKLKSKNKNENEKTDETKSFDTIEP